LSKRFAVDFSGSREAPPHGFDVGPFFVFVFFFLFVFLSRARVHSFFFFFFFFSSFFFFAFSLLARRAIFAF
jgi:hypothetical protein